MGSLNKSFALILIITITVSSLIVVESSFAQSVHAALSSGPTVLWTYPTDGLVYSLAVDGGVVYACSSDNYVYALNANNGAKLWSDNTTYAVEDTPAVANGVIYFGTVSGVFYALNAADGTQLWNLTTQVWNLTTGSAIYGSPTVANGQVYIGNLNHLYDLNASNGEIIWNYSIPSVWDFNTQPFVFASTAAVNNGAVYAIAGDGFNNTLYAVNATNGNPLWNAPIGETVYSPNTAPAVANGKVFVACSINYPPSPGSADIVALNAADGTQLWNRTGPPGGFSTPVVANGALYVTGSGLLLALNPANGVQLWSFNASALFSVPTVVGGEVYAGSWYFYPLSDSPGNIFGLDAATGRVILNYQTKGATAFPGSGSPVFANGVIYALNVNNIFALGGSLVSTPSPSPAPTISSTANSTTSPSPTSTPTVPEFPSLLAVLTLFVAVPVSIAVLVESRKRKADQSKLTD
jgi:eukaryotic-like serine/threonine-protein kinase